MKRKTLINVGRAMHDEIYRLKTENIALMRNAIELMSDMNTKDKEIEELKQEIKSYEKQFEKHALSF